MVILNSGNVGIGVTSPAQKLSIKTNAVTSNPEYIEFTDAGSGSSWAAGQDYGGMQWFMGDGTGIGAHTVAQIKAQNEHTGAAGNAALVFSTAPYNTVMSERMRISSLGLITLSDIAYAVGSAGTSQPRFVPYGDNTIDLGYSGARWEQLWAATSTINTSDANEKQQIENLNEVELKVAKKLKGLIRKFKWNSAVEKKGEDARINFGIIAQDYALFCSNTWWEKEVIEINELGNETKKIKILEEYEDGAIEKTRLGIRYSQLLAFIISAL
jgi:hypothetical protein